MKCSTTQDPIATLALDHGWVTQEQVRICEEVARLLLERSGRKIGVGALLRMRSYISEAQYQRLITLIATQGDATDTTSLVGVTLFGEICIMKGLITPEQLIECLEVQERSIDCGRMPKMIGEILRDRGYLSDASLTQVLELCRVLSLKRLDKTCSRQAA